MMTSAEIQPHYWQCGKSLVQCLDYLFTSEIACDVTFMVGDNKRKKISAHKTILISRSPVFYAMLEGPLAEKGKIILTDISAETFSVFLRYLYTDHIDLTVQTATAILAAARKYCVDQLVDKCQTFIRHTMTADNACLVYEHSHIYMEDSMKEDCLRVISEVEGGGLKSTTFLELCPDCVKSITASDDLTVEEDQVFEAVMSWAIAECVRQGLEVTDVNRREVLADILYNIRFPTMDESFITKRLSVVDLLTADEYRTIVRCQQDSDEYPCILFSNEYRNVPKPAIGMHHCIQRFDNEVHYQKLYKKDEAITFVSSHDIFLHGLHLYSAYNVDGKAKMSIGVYSEEGDTLYKDTHVVTESTSCNIQFNCIISVGRDEEITVVLHGGAHAKAVGMNGKGTVSFHHAEITFMESTLYPSDKTGVTKGQIPGLLLSM